MVRDSNHDCEPFNACTECHKQNSGSLATTQGKNEFERTGKSGSMYPLAREFFWLVIKHGLQFAFFENKLYTAGDDSGEISYTEFAGDECLKWKPYDIETDARRIFELQTDT